MLERGLEAILSIDVKQGQMLQAKAEAKRLKPRSSPRLRRRLKTSFVEALQSLLLPVHGSHYIWVYITCQLGFEIGSKELAKYVRFRVFVPKGCNP